jgi:predicted CXXCH cytochrome family protein
MALAAAIALVRSPLAYANASSNSISDRPAPQSAAASPAAPGFVGARKCGACHEAESKLWNGSHHQLAMQPATQATVLGDFSNASFSDRGITSVFFRRGGKFMVHTEGPDTTLHDYQIKYTFGLSPLQQYLIEFTGGRLQALGIAWDSRAKAAGGQRWFALHPEQKIPTSNPLHWTGIDQTWNFMCADCHTTNLRKNYDLKTRTYRTTFAEIDVACEACHGPGSNHVAWAQKRGDWHQFDSNLGLTIALDERRDVAWGIDPATGNPRRSAPRTSERELRMCARCHSRRAQIHEDFVHGQPLGDDYRASLLSPDLYFPDGQIKGEVYEYGSFIQSRMFHEGVTCSDCHEPHSARLRASGNKLCTQCHPAPRYDSPRHHFHPIGSRGARCIECHMPARTYMVVDPRRDHSLRIPRPDLSVKVGSPNACNNCHTDKSAGWAEKILEQRYGHAPRGFQRFAETLNAGTLEAPGAELSLEQLIADREQPAISRATALTMMENSQLSPASPAIPIAIHDPSELVRRGLAQASSNTDPNSSAPVLSPLLSDPVRAVRIETAEVLAGAANGVLPESSAAALDAAIREYLDVQRQNDDRPEAHLNLSSLYIRQKRFDRAEAELKLSLALDPSFAPAAVNLADLYRGLGRDDEGEAVLRQALRRMPQDASILNALGLCMVRRRQKAQALDMFAAAARLDPSVANYSYTFAVALNDAGHTKEAIQTLERCIELHPYDRESLAALVAFCDQTGDTAKALKYAETLAELEPDDPRVRQMLEEQKNRLRQ